MDFQRSQTLLEKALRVQQLGLEDAQHALQQGNLLDINHERNNLSDAVVNLSKRLSEAIELSIESDVEVDDIQTWRADMKRQIAEIKFVVSQLDQAETEGRKAIQEEDIRQRRAFEEEEKQRELKWIKQKLECESAMSHTAPSLEEDTTEQHEIEHQIEALPEPPTNETEVSHPTSAPEQVSELLTTPQRPEPTETTAPTRQPTEYTPAAEPSAAETLQMMQQLLTLNHNGTPAKPPGVKLQKYSITPFQGDICDFTRFWAQFNVEVDQANLAEISKFNYLLELVKGKAREQITGLPHTIEGYEAAKDILKEKYGKPQRVLRTIIQELENLPHITTSSKVEQAHAFHDKLSKTVRTLHTMGYLPQVEGLIHTILMKLGPVREIIIQKDDDWESWNLQELVKNLGKFTDRNPLAERQPSGGNRDKDDGRKSDKPRHEEDWRMTEHPSRHEKTLMNKDQTPKKKYQCVYCKTDGHYSDNCTKILDAAARKELLVNEKRCFNCTSSQHTARDCTSRKTCYNCRDKHHTSICTHRKPSTIGGEENQDTQKADKAYSAITGAPGHPSALVKIGNQNARIVVDTMSTCSYVGSDIITRLQLKPKRRELRTVELMYGSENRMVEVFDIKITSQSGNTDLWIEATNVNRPVITEIPNPWIRRVKFKEPKLRGIRFTEEKSAGDLLPVHLLLGVQDFNRIKMERAPIIGGSKQRPVAEQTTLGWILYAGGANSPVINKCYLTMTGPQQFQAMVRLDVLGLEEPAEQSFNHEEFKKQIQMTAQGKYQSCLPWKPDTADLPDNKTIAHGRLQSTTNKLERTGQLQAYDAIMQEHAEQGLLVPAESGATKVHYIPHHPVFKESETTPIRIVYDCSARESKHSPSLNDLLETGPPLQPHLWDVLLRSRFKRYLITGDIQKAFHQIKLTTSDQNFQRVLWYQDLTSREITEYQFTRVIFGSTSSPYILGATIEKHLQQYDSGGVYGNTLQSLISDTYVDDVQGGGESAEDVHKFKKEAAHIMQEGGFKLCKWHSNVKEAEEADNKPMVKTLGIPWNKQNDTLTIDAKPSEDKTLTKRKTLAAINAVFDPLQWTAPFMLTAKLIFSDICLQSLHWDQTLPEGITNRWREWEAAFKRCHQVTVPRAVCSQRGSTFQLHGFADASQVAVCATIYTVELNQDRVLSTNLLVAKSRVAPKSLTIPRLELVAAHTLAKLMSNVMTALENIRITDTCYWSDSTTALHWIQHKGTWSIFVRNRVHKIQELTKNAHWQHVPTHENPSDLGTRGIPPHKIGDLWLKGPKFLITQVWPEQPDITETADTSAEKLLPRVTKLMMNQNTEVFLETMAEHFKYQRILRITAWILRFKDNCRKEGHTGTLQTTEIKRSETTLLKLAQNGLDQQALLHAETHDDGVQRIQSRVQGNLLIPLPHSMFLQRIIEYQHQQTFHGGVSSTMAAIREKFHVKKLRTLVKSFIHRCNRCKQHRVKRIGPPRESDLPKFRTEFTRPFEATGVDFAGPFYVKALSKERNEVSKAYVALFTCSTTRAVHLELCEDLSARQFQLALKLFIARRGTPKMMVSDNAKTFQATKAFLDIVTQDEEVNDYINQQRIEWRFNLSCAPWWGGFWERMVGLMKNALKKSVGNAYLTFNELREVLVGVENCLNNRPLTYLEEEQEQPVLTPNRLMGIQDTTSLEIDLDALNYTEEDKLITKRMKYLHKTREQLKARFMREYLTALHERGRCHNPMPKIPSTGTVVLITESQQGGRKPAWRLARVSQHIAGNDEVIRGLRLRLGNGHYVERPLQLVRNLEIHPLDDEEPCDASVDDDLTTTQPTGEQNLALHIDNSPHHEIPTPVDKRRRRKAKDAAVDRMTGICLELNEEN